MLRLLNAIDAFDRRLFHRLTRRERRAIDRGLTRLTTAANRSLLWLLIAVLLAVFGGRRGRRAALRGAVAIGLTSTLVNLPLKYLARRDRPPRRHFDRPLPISVPGSFSFPSGHSASAFAFLTGVGREDARLAIPLAPLAAGVAYSRVHLRVHYPLDVVAGATIGSAMGLASGPLLRVAQRWWESTLPVPTPERPPTSQLILVVNRKAGRNHRLERARRAMAERGLEIAHEISVEHLSRLGALLDRNARRPPIVVAAGGDGTVGSVADFIIGSPAVLGVLPLGTSNDFARSIEIPMKIEHAVRLLSRGRVSRVDAGRLLAEGHRPRHFVHAAALGLNVNFAKLATRAELRARLGRLTYAVAAARALQERPVFECEVEWEGQRERLSLVHLAVINAPVFGGFLNLKVPGARPEDRAFDVVMIEHLPMRRLIESALQPIVGLHREIRGFRTLRTNRLIVRSSRPMDVTLDGEVSGKVPGSFEVMPGGLRVITPVSFTDRLR